MAILKENRRSFVSGGVSRSKSIGIQAGMFFPNFSDLNFSLQHQYGQSLGIKLYGIGASFESSRDDSTGFNYNSILSYQYFPASQSLIADSIHIYLSGFQVGYAIGKDVFPNVSWFDLGIYAGFSVGRFRLFKQDPGISYEFLQYRNPFFSPKVIVEPRFNLRRFVYAIRVEYLADVSNSQWKVKDGRATAIGDARSTGFFIQVYAGISLHR